MLERLNRYLEGSEKGVYVFLIWSFIGAVIGAVVGVVGITFHILLEEVTAFRMSHPWILFLLPLGGLVIAGLYHLLRMQNDRGTNLILIAVRVNEKVSLRLTPLIFISTIITHLLGGSAGREGAALQIGGSIGSFIGRKIKLDEKDERIITMCGMSAGFAALFGTPVAAVVFSMEVITVGIMHYSAIVPSIIAAITATGISMACGVTPTSFTLESVPALSPSGVGSVILLGMFCAGVSVRQGNTINKSLRMDISVFLSGDVLWWQSHCCWVPVIITGQGWMSLPVPLQGKRNIRRFCGKFF